MFMYFIGLAITMAVAGGIVFMMSIDERRVLSNDQEEWV